MNCNGCKYCSSPLDSISCKSCDGNSNWVVNPDYKLEIMELFKSTVELVKDFEDTNPEELEGQAFQNVIQILKQAGQM